MKNEDYGEVCDSRHDGQGEGESDYHIIPHGLIQLVKGYFRTSFTCESHISIPFLFLFPFFLYGDGQVRTIGAS